MNAPTLAPPAIVTQLSQDNLPEKPEPMEPMEPMEPAQAIAVPGKDDTCVLANPEACLLLNELYERDVTLFPAMGEQGETVRVVMADDSDPKHGLADVWDTLKAHKDALITWAKQAQSGRVVFVKTALLNGERICSAADNADLSDLPTNKDGQVKHAKSEQWCSVYRSTDICALHALRHRARAEGISDAQVADDIRLHHETHTLFGGRLVSDSVFVRARPRFVEEYDGVF